MLYFDHLDSPIGPLLLIGDGTALLEIGLPVDGRAPAAPTHAQAAAMRLQTARQQLTEYFAGSRRQFDLPLRPIGTAFQCEVWRALQDIPYGQTCSYGAIARRIGRPRAMRAVGAANGANPLSIIVPCHRVIGSHGDLVGYGGGLAIKRWLLAHEQQHAPCVPLVLAAPA